MLSKNEFVAVIETIEEVERFYRAVDSTCRDFGIGYDEMHWDLNAKLESVLVDVLSNMFGDQGEWLLWWLYECDFGKEDTSVEWIDDKTGEKVVITIDTPESLYRFLVNNMKEREE